MDYSPKITAQKSGVIGSVASVGVVVEIIVDHIWPGLFPNGTITAAAVTIWTAVQNYWKNKD